MITVLRPLPVIVDNVQDCGTLNTEPVELVFTVSFAVLTDTTAISTPFQKKEAKTEVMRF